MNAEEARENERLTRARVQGIELGASRAGREAAIKAEAAYKAAHDLDGARLALREAVAARIAVEDGLPSHEWEGRKVRRTAPQGRAFERLPDRIIEGVVETFRSTTPLPGNTPTYRRPQIGSPIVRLLRADGSLGSKFEPLLRSPYESQWELARGIEAGTATSLDDGAVLHADNHDTSNSCDQHRRFQGSSVPHE